MPILSRSIQFVRYTKQLIAAAYKRLRIRYVHAVRIDTQNDSNQTRSHYFRLHNDKMIALSRGRQKVHYFSILLPVVAVRMETLKWTGN